MLFRSGQIPRIGGVAIVVALIIGISYLLIRNSLQWPLAIGCGTVLLVSSVSFLDDVYKLAPLFRLSVQVLAAATAISAGINISLIHLPGIAYPPSYIFTVVFTLLFMIWMTNLYNFMDGMDGLAGGMAVVGFSVLGCLGLHAGDIG